MIVVSPTHAWLSDAVADCIESFCVSSPYVGPYFTQVLSQLNSTVPITLLTRTTLADFASRASDLETVRSVAARAGTILSLSSLHAKVYVIDRKRALITSANSTFSGMYRNRECGFEVRDKGEVEKLREFVCDGFGSSPAPQPWTVEDLEGLRAPVERLRAAIPQVVHTADERVESVVRLRLSRRQYSQFVGDFAGWLRLTLEGISLIRHDVFTMNDVMAACEPLARRRFPDNRHVRPKLRQQMQRLRDLGLVVFLGGGRYQRVATS